MWRERILGITSEVELGPPATLDHLAEVQDSLNWRMPASLHSLLLECNGLVAWSAEYVWSTERLLEMEDQFQPAAEFDSLYLPFDGLNFFGDNGGGDQFAFVDRAGKSDVFVWEHEDDSRRWVANDLEDFLVRALGSGGADWYSGY